MTPNPASTVIGHLTVHRTAHDPHGRIFAASAVNPTYQRQAADTPLNPTDALGSALGDILSNQYMVGNYLLADVADPARWRLLELQVSAHLRRHLGWNHHRVEVAYTSSNRVPSQRLYLWHTHSPAIRRIWGVIWYAGGSPWQTPAVRTPALDADLAQLNCHVQQSADGFIVTADDPARWDDPAFEARVIDSFRARLRWTNDDLLVVHSGTNPTSTGLPPQLSDS